MRVWAPWNHSCHTWLGHLGPVFCVFHTLSFSEVHHREWLPDHRDSSSRVTLGAQELILEGCSPWWRWHPCLLIRQEILYFSRFSSVQLSCSVVSDSLWPHGLQHARTPYPSPTPGVYSNSCPLSQWCHPTISSSIIPFSSHLQSFPASGSFQESVLRIRWPKCWGFSFSISPSNEYSGWFSLRKMLTLIFA